MEVLSVGRRYTRCVTCDTCGSELRYVNFLHGEAPGILEGEVEGEWERGTDKAVYYYVECECCDCRVQVPEP